MGVGQENQAVPDFKTVTLTSLGSIITPDQGAGSEIEPGNVVIMVPAGLYTRRAPFFLDADEAEPGTKTSAEQYFSVLSQQYRAVRMVGLADARITGQGAVITRGNLLVKESVLEFTAQGRAPDGFTIAGANTYTMPERVDRLISAPCILAKRPWYRNFGHWLVDGATVVALAADLIGAANLTVVTGTFGSPKMRAVVRDTIEQLAPGAAVLEHPDEEIWQFDDLHYVTPPHVPPLFKLPEPLRRMRSRFLGNTIFAPHRKIFITRRAAGNRRLVNEEEIFALCAARGFELVDPEDLSIREQAKLFAEAQAIIGVKGAALTTCLFCRPDTKILVLSPADFPDPFFWDVAAQNGCDYGELFGPIVTSKARGLNEFTVEPARVEAMLNAAGL